VKDKPSYEEFLELSPEIRELDKLTLPRYYDRDGSPMPTSKWTWLFSYFEEYRLVEQTEIGQLLVSTVWLGIDHSFGYGDEPIIFETMVFGLSDEWDEYMQRYSTEEEAKRGHEQVVTAIRELENIK